MPEWMECSQISVHSNAVLQFANKVHYCCCMKYSAHVADGRDGEAPSGKMYRVLQYVGTS